MSKKRCKHCKEYKTDGVQLPAGFFCSFDSAIKWANEKKSKQSDKDHRARKTKHKANDKPLRMKQAQSACNAYIRKRDEKEPCISCQRHHNGQYHAGHFRSVGACSALKFNELNINKQCQPCNNHLSGNLIHYRENLIKKIGLEKVEWLECQNEPTRYTCSNLKALELHFKAKLKLLN